MKESEQALSDALDRSNHHDARIAKQVLRNSKIYKLWESRHADLVVAVAKHSRRAPQIFSLRDIAVQLLHRRALIKHIREQHVVDEERDNLLSVFYGPKDALNAIFAEYRQYILSEASWLSTGHLIKIMCDSVSTRLLREYESIYSEYFKLYCFVVSCDDSATVAATRVEMFRLGRRATQMIKRIRSEVPDGGHSGFERQALLAQSGRYPVLDYMVG